MIVSQVAGRYMIGRKRGKIINICSVQSELGRPTIVPYTVSKGGIKMLTKALCSEWAKYNIQVNAIGPGYFETELTKPLKDNPEFDKWLCDRTPASRWGKPKELIGAAVFLASQAGDYVNGHILYVDGGLLSSV
jgi:gluconate 5-dehydrogenase